MQTTVLLFTRLLGRTSYLILLLLLSFACTEEDEDDLVGNWVRRSDFEGVPRSNAVAFSIGDFAYVGLGFDGDEDLRDFWRYDPTLDFWTMVDSFPATARRAAVGFSVAGKGYVSTGFNGDLEEEFQDCWAFDPEAPAGSQWTRVADFPGTARYDAVAFTTENTAYVGSGFDDNWLKDFYRYNPATDSWAQVVSLGGSKRESATAFSLNGRHYVGTGRNNGIYEFDFWQYDPEISTWRRMEDLDEDDDYNIARHGAVSFTLGNLGYVATGSNGVNMSSVWAYDPALDEWEEKTAFEGISRTEAVSFVVNGRAFITTGRNGGARFDDLREFFPNEEFDEDD